jgi:ABC-2 type transport system permease protein
MGLVRTETVKATRRMRTYVSFAILIVIPIIMASALKANPPDQGERGGGGGLFFLTTHTGLVMPAAALRLMSTLPLLITVVAIFGGDAMAGDASWGNLRFVLMRPVARVRLLWSKFLVAVLLSWLSVVAVVLSGLAIGVILFGWHPLDLNFVFRSYHESIGSLLGHIALATVYVAWMLTGLVAFTFMLSCMTDSPSGATIAGVGLYIASQILDAIDPLGSLRYGLPTHYLDSWVDLFTQNSVSSDMARGALLTVGYVLLFTGIAVWWFRRKDILS